MHPPDRRNADAGSVRLGACGDHSNHNGESRDLPGRSLKMARAGSTLPAQKVMIEAGCARAMGRQLDSGGAFMKERLRTIIRRRDLLRVAIASAGVAAASTMVLEPARAKSVDLKDKRKARYQASSAEVRNFYRVNSYPAR
jgi:hypothetical protein